MIPLILTMGCIFFLCIGVGLIAWAVCDMAEDGPDLPGIIMLLVGIGIGVLSLSFTTKAIKYYREKESLKPEITTSIPPQIDTIITIRNGVSDSVYVYKFNLTER